MQLEAQVLRRREGEAQEVGEGVAEEVEEAGLAQQDSLSLRPSRASMGMDVSALNS